MPVPVRYRYRCRYRSRYRPRYQSRYRCSPTRPFATALGLVSCLLLLTKRRMLSCDRTGGCKATFARWMACRGHDCGRAMILKELACSRCLEMNPFVCVGVGGLHCVSCVSDGLCVCSLVTLVVFCGCVAVFHFLYSKRWSVRNQVPRVARLIPYIAQGIGPPVRPP